MRNKSLSIALAFVTLVGLVPLTATTAEASDDEIVEITTAGTCNYDYANEVAELVNEERAAAGLNTLVNDKRLTEWAMQRAAEQAFYFGHVRPDGTGWDTVLDQEEFGYPNYLSGGENAAMGQTTPTQVMDSWMNSAGHKATLMRDDFTAVGVGCVKMGGYTYWIQIFAGPSKGAGGDYEIIESTYSGSKVQTFTISTYTSNLKSFHATFCEGVFGSFVVGAQKTYRLYVKGGGMSKAPGSAYVVPIDVSDVKDESTGEVIATASVAADGAVTITATAAGTGYLYLYPYEGATPQSVELVIFAGYTVTFDSDGGSCVSTQTVAYNSSATEPTAPTRKGYVFDGWYAIVDQYDEEQDDWNQINVTYDFSTTVTEDITLYASWKADTTSTTTKSEETTKSAETTTAVPETTTKSEETTKVAETTTGVPDETAGDVTEETTGVDDETTDDVTETTDDATEETETTAEDESTAETETETTAVVSDNDTSDDDISDSDNAALTNDGDDANDGDEDKGGSYVWIVVLVVVLLAAIGVTVFVVLKKNKSGETANAAESAETENDNVENDSADGSTGGDDE